VGTVGAFSGGKIGWDDEDEAAGSVKNEVIAGVNGGVDSGAIDDGRLCGAPEEDGCVAELAADFSDDTGDPGKDDAPGGLQGRSDEDGAGSEQVR